MKTPLRKRSSQSEQAELDEKIRDAVTDVIRESTDKTVEIRPADGSNGRKRFTRLLFVGAVLAVVYWLRTSERPGEKVQRAASGVADWTRRRTGTAAETIQRGGETVSERVEEESQRAGDRIQQTGESVAERTEQAGETAAERVEQGSEKAEEQVQQTAEGVVEKTERIAESTDESGGSSSEGSSSS